MLVTEEMDIITQCLLLLQENGYIEKELTLREAYDKYIHPDKLPLEDDKLWDAVDTGDILALFQLTSTVGNNMVKKLKPRNVEMLTACNALIRLMPEGLDETPGDRYLRFKADISQWYAEMNSCGLTKEEQKVLEKYCLADFGVPSSQEAAMLIFMDKDICGFTLGEANDARRVISKKKMDKIPELKEKVLTTAKSYNLGKYVWDKIIALQMGYSFSRLHGFTYSLIGCQAAYLATYFPSVFWNTAYLRVISGLDKDASSNYGKIAKGVGEIISHNTGVTLIDINKSDYFFTPDVENNSIRYGLKALNGVGGDIIEQIIQNRPYNSLQDFMEKNSFNKTVMISLIKSGAFDQFGERKEIMKDYIWEISGTKKRITMQNYNGLLENDLIPEEYSFQNRVFVFNKALKKYCKINTSLYSMNANYYDFYEQFFDLDLLTPYENGLAIAAKDWKKLYDEALAPIKKFIQENKDDLLSDYNNILFQSEWDKYAAGSYSHWEMESLGFYYHEHELIDVNDSLYDIKEFDSHDEEPIVDRTYTRNGRTFSTYITDRICGTVIAKDDLKSSISILTKGSGVVNVKFTRDYYAKYNQTLSEVGADGVKHRMENSWFKKGTLIVVNGFRRGNTFVAKSYKNTPSHQLYKITGINHDNGTMDITNLRYGEVEE